MSQLPLSTVHVPNAPTTTRRRFIRDTSSIAAASTLVASSIPKVHAAENNEIRVAIVGCGGRGTGAVDNALSVDNGSIKLVAMADVYQNKLESSYGKLKEKFGDKVDVPEERRFYEFDGYKQAMDTLQPGDVVVLTTPCAFRWVHFTYAIERGLNVFMEKPLTADGPSSRKMFELGKLASEKNLKVGVGLMCRHCDARAELHKRIQDGEIGDITMLRAYRMAGPTGSAATLPKPKDWPSNELMYQISRFHSFLWLSGGAFSDFLIHNIDECCWMKEAWPVEAKASGGRQYRNDYVDQNFDTYSVEYTFDDGTKLFLNGRTIPGCHQEFASYVHGTKGSGVISTSGHSPAKCRIYNGHKMTKANERWAFAGKEPKPHQLEWDHLIQAIREDKPYNEVERGVKASLVTSMGRMAAHTGQTVTYDEMLNCPHEFAPGLEQLNRESQPPLLPNDSGKYPIPQPGILADREY
ncbi:MAG: Gfo/Idh/MocA family oxidoreductase [Pirellulaceae bacterium]|nr:Gfo/Idh/MocA family oxidoreductase [Pirellulaceae bacterium]